jgi:hypothetical protein
VQERRGGRARGARGEGLEDGVHGAHRSTLDVA